MRPATRLLLTLAALLPLAACNTPHNNPIAPPPTNAPVARQPDTSRPDVHRETTTDSMLAQIIAYYRDNYANDSVRMTITRTDSLIQLSFADSIPGPDKYDGILLLAAIALPDGRIQGLQGDLNGDGLDDRLVSIHTEGGGGGGNVWWDDHFVFLAEAPGKYRLADSQSDGELIDGPGYFFPDEIKGGTVSGTSNEYAENDGHCCPSLYYRVSLRMQDGRLKAISKKGTSKPASF